MEFIFGLVRWVVIIVLLGVVLFRIFRIIRPFETGLVERLGKSVSYTHLRAHET